MKQEYFTVGSDNLTALPGWRETELAEERVVLRTQNGRQQAIISTLRFDDEVSFDDFKKLCARRIDTEKNVLEMGFIQSGVPFAEADMFGMFFSGGEKNSCRVFSGYLTLAKKKMVTVYIESADVALKEHLQAFRILVKGLHRQ